MKALLNQFQELENQPIAKIIGIRNYLSSTSGEVADYRVNLNVSPEKVKQADLARLQKLTNVQLDNLAAELNVSRETIDKNLNSLVTSLVKNTSENMNSRTVNSQAQTDAYKIIFDGAVKIHKETLKIFVYGYKISKKVLIAGEYKQVNSRIDTIVKSKLKKLAKVKMDNYRIFELKNCKAIAINGQVYNID